MAVVVLVASSRVLSIVFASSSTLTTHPPPSLKFHHTLPGKPPLLDPFRGAVAGASRRRMSGARVAALAGLLGEPPAQDVSVLSFPVEMRYEPVFRKAGALVQSQGGRIGGSDRQHQAFGP